MKNPLISVIVPVYNAEAYLEECIQSIVSQTYKNLEIILVDDSSPDKCPEICDNWAQKDLRIKVIHKTNGGASSARNAGLDVATGDFLGFVDSDDFIAPDMFEEMLFALISSNKKISYCGTYRMESNGTTVLDAPTLKKDILNTSKAVNGILYGEIDTSLCSKLFEKSVFEGIRFPEGESNEEFPLLIPLMVKSNGIVLTGKAFYYYRAREGSVTTFYYLHESSSGLVLKNLNIIKKQILEYELQCNSSYRLFTAKSSLSLALAMEKKYKLLSEKIIKDYRLFKKNMWKYLFTYLFSRRIKFKDKILYILVLTKLLRPFYRVFYRDHL